MIIICQVRYKFPRGTPTPSGDGLWLVINFLIEFMCGFVPATTMTRHNR